MRKVNLNSVDLRGAVFWLTDMLNADVQKVRIMKKEYEYICQQEVINIDTVIIDTENE